MALKVANFVLMLIICVTLLAVKPLTSSGLENEKLSELIEKFDMLQAEMKYQKTDIIQLKSENEELKARLSQQDEKIAQLEKAMSKQEPFGPHPKPTDSCTKKVSSNTASKINKKPSSRALPLLLPTSCDGLRKEGHFANGIYLVLNEITKKIEAVLCQFLGAKQVVQELVGNIDVKTKPAHFYAQRNSSFSAWLAVIPFELARLNEGDAFNLISGIFTAPVAGIYHFDFSALKEESSPFFEIFLQVNGQDVGIGPTPGPATRNVDSVSLSASLRLEAGDTVNLFNEGGALFDDSYHRTHFTGWLVEEDLM